MAASSKLESNNQYWMFNVMDPTSEEFFTHAVSPEAKEDAKPGLAAWLQKYLENFSLRDPQPTKVYTTEQLKEMGYKGVYRK